MEKEMEHFPCPVNCRFGVARGRETKTQSTDVALVNNYPPSRPLYGPNWNAAWEQQRNYHDTEKPVQRWAELPCMAAQVCFQYATGEPVSGWLALRASGSSQKNWVRDWLLREMHTDENNRTNRIQSAQQRSTSRPSEEGNYSDIGWSIGHGTNRWS